MMVELIGAYAHIGTKDVSASTRSARGHTGATPDDRIHRSDQSLALDITACAGGRYRAVNSSGTAWERFKGRGMYPVEYAGWLLSPFRHLIAPTGTIARRLDLKPSDQVLEIGCGPGFFSAAVSQRLATGRLTLFDAQDGMIRLAEARLKRRGISNFQTSIGTAEKLPFPDETFDVAFMVTVLGEVPNRPLALAEAMRVLRRGGRLSITEAAGDPDRVRRAEIEHLATGAGLTPEHSWRGLFVETFNYLRPAE